MKKLTGIVLAVAAAMLMTACNASSEQDAAATDSVTESPPSSYADIKYNNISVSELLQYSGEDIINTFGTPTRKGFDEAFSINYYDYDLESDEYEYICFNSNPQTDIVDCFYGRCVTFEMNGENLSKSYKELIETFGSPIKENDYSDEEAGQYSFEADFAYSGYYLNFYFDKPVGEETSKSYSVTFSKNQPVLDK